MATTTNYGWTTPDDTSLVKDGASAIRTLGSSVDTTVKNLNPETTLGDISYRSSTANTNTRLAIGTTGQVLTVNGGVPTWATASSGGMTSIASGTLSGSETTLTSISGSYNDLILVVNNPFVSGANASLNYRFNGITTNTYQTYGVKSNGTAAANSNDRVIPDFLENTLPQATNSFSCVIIIPSYSTTNNTKMGNYNFVTSTAQATGNAFGAFSINTSSAITSISIRTGNATTFSGGTYTLYGVK